jgi:hypothetical protein
MQGLCSALCSLTLFSLSFGTPHTGNRSKTNRSMSRWTISVVMVVATPTSTLWSTWLLAANPWHFIMVLLVQVLTTSLQPKIALWPTCSSAICRPSCMACSCNLLTATSFQSQSGYLSFAFACKQIFWSFQVGPFRNIGLNVGSLNDPYQRSNFGYSM